MKVYYKEVFQPDLKHLINHEIAFDMSRYYIRHNSFKDIKTFRDMILNLSPANIFRSNALYKHPAKKLSNEKVWRGAPFLIDIDVDGKHANIPCQKNHPANYMCVDCLAYAKKEVFKLIDNHLLTTFAIPQKDISITFSGNRGFHVEVSNDSINQMDSGARREFADYLRGDSLDTSKFKTLTTKDNLTSLGFSKNHYSEKIIAYLREIIKDIAVNNLDPLDAHNLNKKILYHFKKNISYLQIPREYYSLQYLEGKDWDIVLNAIIAGIGVNLDFPVSTDIYRLTRFENSLHAKTGLKVMEIKYEDLETFSPLIDALPFSHKGTNLYMEKNHLGLHIPYMDYDESEIINEMKININQALMYSCLSN